MIKNTLIKGGIFFMIFISFFSNTYSLNSDDYEQVAEKAFKKLETKLEKHTDVKKLLYYSYLYKKLDKILLELDDNEMEQIVQLLLEKIDKEIDDLKLNIVDNTSTTTPSNSTNTSTNTVNSSTSSNTNSNTSTSNDDMGCEYKGGIIPDFCLVKNNPIGNVSEYYVNSITKTRYSIPERIPGNIDAARNYCKNKGSNWRLPTLGDITAYSFYSSFTVKYPQSINAWPKSLNPRFIEQFTSALYDYNNGKVSSIKYDSRNYFFSYALTDSNVKNNRFLHIPVKFEDYLKFYKNEINDGRRSSVNINSQPYQTSNIGEILTYDRIFCVSENLNTNYVRNIHFYHNGGYGSCSNDGELKFFSYYSYYDKCKSLGLVCKNNRWTLDVGLGHKSVSGVMYTGSECIQSAIETPGLTSISYPYLTTSGDIYRELTRGGSSSSSSGGSSSSSSGGSSSSSSGGSSSSSSGGSSSSSSGGSSSSSSGGSSSSSSSEYSVGEYYKGARANPMSGQGGYWGSCDTDGETNSFSFERSRWDPEKGTVIECSSDLFECDSSRGWTRYKGEHAKEYTMNRKWNPIGNKVYKDRHCGKDPLGLYGAGAQVVKGFMVKPTKITIDIANPGPIKFLVVLTELQHHQLAYSIKITEHPNSPSSVSDTGTEFTPVWDWNSDERKYIAEPNWKPWGWPGSASGLGWEFKLPYDEKLLGVAGIKGVISVRDIRNPDQVVEVHIETIDSSPKKDEEEEK